MLKEYIHITGRQLSSVLILILMEHAQRGTSNAPHSIPCRDVLILILMEHAQRVSGLSQSFRYVSPVLILILMEHAQRVTLIKRLSLVTWKS